MHKIAFVVCAGRYASAGHHYSARDLGIALRANNVSVHYIVIRPRKECISAALLGEPNVSYFEASLANPGAILKLRGFLLKGCFDAVFPLDEFSARLVFSIAPRLCSRISPIKPGSVNSEAWPKSFANFICFSEENFDFYSGNPKYRHTRLHFLPQRVVKLQQRAEITAAFNERIHYRPNEKVILAGARINLGDERHPGKKPVFTSAIRLYHEIRKYEENARLVLVGTPKSERELEWISSLVSRDQRITVVTEPAFTSCLSQLFFSADFIIGMGRTAMEAMSIGKVALIPVGDWRLPVPITQENYAVVSRYNFTYRFSNGEVSVDDDMLSEQIKQLATESGYRHAAMVGRQIFDEQMDVAASMPTYLRIIADKKRISVNRGVLMWLHSCARMLGILVRSDVRKLRSMMNHAAVRDARS